MLKKWQYISGIVGILLLVISLLSDTWLYPNISQAYAKSQAKHVQHSLLEKQKEADNLLQTVAAIPLNKLQSSYNQLYDNSNSAHILLYIKRIDGGFVYYSSNSVFPQTVVFSATDSELQHLPNGYYLQNNLLANGLIYIALVPVQYQYTIENEYLKNTIPFLKTNNDFTLSRNQKQGYPVYDLSHRYLFSLSAKTALEPFGWIALLFIAGLVLFFTFCSKVISDLITHQKKLWASSIYLFANAFFIYSWKIVRLPDNLYRFPIFSSHYYGSSAFFSSLGDLLIFSLIIGVAFVFIRKIRIRLHFPDFLNYFFLFLFTVISCFFSVGIVKLISSLILDSIISFDLGNIFSLDLYSVSGIVIILILVACYFLFFDYFSRSVFGKIKSTPLFLLIAFFAFVIVGFIVSNLSGTYYIAYAFNTVTVLLYYYKTKIFRFNLVAFTLACITATSVFLSIVLSKYNGLNESDDRQTIATSIITERDYFAEYLFTGIYDGIEQDNYLKNYFTLPVISEPVLESRIKQVYLSGYFSKYEVVVNTFNPDGSSYKNILAKPLSFYSALLEKEGTPVGSDRLYFLHLHTGLPTYVSQIPISVQGRVVGIILIEFQQKPFYEESIYPELLVSENLRKYSIKEKYSYAVYSNGMLLNQKGEYAYPGFQNFKVQLDSNNFASVNKDGFEHLLYQPHPDLLVIVSARSQGWVYYLSSFAFVFLFIVIGFLSGILTRFLYRISNVILRHKQHLIRKIFGLQNLSFRNKILITVITGMTLSIILIGIVTVSYIRVQYNNDELINLRKKTRLIATKLSDELQQNEKQPELGGPDLPLMVKTLSDNYQADINIFSVKGNLVNSTENAIFDKGIIAPEMDASAFQKFSQEQTSQVINEERIGKLKYLSCYIPLRNLTGQVIGYLNLPYFSKEQELKDRISSFVVTLVNLYFLLFLILVVLGVFMTRALTLPLNIIRNHLKNTSLSGSNEFITWNTNDEIGKLVSEYNTMIVALKESVDRLAQSEREDALRELAQHVAHEIKNPLTPMKLGVQQLQNAYRNKSADYDILFEKVTNLVIRQIDTLSSIATDFNDSAKIGNPVPLNINLLLQQISDLFSHNASLSIRHDFDPKSDLLVFADANKLNRVFTNLLNNAVQAIPETRRGIITIRSRQNEDEVIVSIEDNGSGIPDLLRKKIFIPNFSTKSSGTGLGLAIVKAIIEQAGGNISFTSIVDKGSVFTVSLPLYHSVATTESIE